MHIKVFSYPFEMAQGAASRAVSSIRSRFAVQKTRCACALPLKPLSRATGVNTQSTVDLHTCAKRRSLCHSDAA